jgi:membrane protease YdiL (CAAX protease family)
MASLIFLNKQRRLRNGWWVAIFFLVLAVLLFPAILLSKNYGFELTILHQALIITAASVLCQLLRAEPFEVLLGAFNLQWIKELFVGGMIGALLMLMPALFLYAFCDLSWQKVPIDVKPLLSATMLFVGVAFVEELLFRGFIFQRLIEGIGEWPAQLLIGGLFLLTHIGNPGMKGSIQVYASLNIFLASIMFGLAFVKTKSLALPIGIHFMANWVQGVALGFGVSGMEQASLLRPVLAGTPEWLTGGVFGLEASIPGMVSLVFTTLVLYNWPFKLNPNKQIISAIL